MPRCKLLLHRTNRWYHNSVWLSTGLGKKEGDSLSDLCLCPFLQAQPSEDLDCSTLEGWLLTNSMKPTIRTKEALDDAAQLHTEQPLKFDDYTYITEEAKATLALPVWYSKKFLQSHTLYSAAPKTFQVLVGCVKSLLSCYLFRQKGRQANGRWNSLLAGMIAKFTLLLGGSVMSQQEHQTLTSLSWPNQTSPLTAECNILPAGRNCIHLKRYFFLACLNIQYNPL